MSTPAARDAIEDIYELTPIQQGLLFHSLYEPGSGVYLEQVVCCIRGDLDVASLQRAFAAVVHHHPVLRTGFHWQGFKKPLQVVLKSVTVPWQTVDLRDCGPGEQRRRTTAWLEADQSRSFSLDAAPLSRCAVLQLSNRSSRFVWTFHHLLLDGWSLAVVFADLFAAYDAAVTKQYAALPPTRPYRDYVLWRQRRTDVAAADYWRRYLVSATPTRLAHGAASVAARGTHEEASSSLSPAATSQLMDLARAERVTLSTIVSGAVAAVLARQTGRDDVLFGSAVAGRPAELEGSERMVGLFVNALPLRIRVDPQAAVGSWLRGLQQAQLERDRHAYESLVDIQGWSDVPRGTPLFETLLVFENYPFPSRSGNARIDIVDMRALERTNYPLTVVVTPGERLHVRAAWYESAGRPAQARRMLAHLVETLEAIADPALSSVGDLPAFGSADRAQLRAWSTTPRTGAVPVSAQSITDVIGARASADSDSVAVVCGDASLTYRELEESANALAWQLRDAGIGPDTCVGIALARTPTLVSAVLGVLKAGAAFVPIEPTHPPERLEWIVRDAGISLILCRAAEAEWLPTTGVRLLDPGTAGRARHAPPCQAEDGHLAYVIYTSGSTGTPKGCAVTRRAFANLLYWYGAALDADPVRTLIVSSFEFDLTQKNLLTPLMRGGSVHLQTERYFDSRSVCEYIARHDITLLNCTPSAFHSLVEAAAADGYRALASLRQVVLGGEPVAWPPLRPWLSAPGCRARVMNSYGPTECADVTVAAWIEPPAVTDRGVPIGRPVPHTSVYVVDEALRLVPVGAVGELCLGGSQVGRGYVAQPSPTAERFVPDPFSSDAGARMYRTGDLVRFCDDGQLEFVGRRDTQVKLRGHRIELGEIEAVLRNHPDVRDAAVVVTSEGGGPSRLVAYVVAHGGLRPDGPTLQRHARRWLPDVMVPTAWVAVDRLPLTDRGKVDRTQLRSPTPSLPADGVNEGDPAGAIEQELSAIWAQVLGVKHVGRYDNFFDLGGHSLNATLVISRIHQRLHAELPLRTLFEAPTVTELASVLARTMPVALEPLTTVPRQPQVSDPEPRRGQEPLGR